MILIKYGEVLEITDSITSMDLHLSYIKVKCCDYPRTYMKCTIFATKMHLLSLNLSKQIRINDTV